jgi:cell filamentation protein
MSNSYKYIDPDYTYTDPKTGILRNLQDISDSDVLLFVESGVVTKAANRYGQVYEKTNKLKKADKRTTKKIL